MNKKIVSLAILVGLLANFMATNVSLARTKSSQMDTFNISVVDRDSWEYISTHYTVKCYSTDGTMYQYLCKYYPKNFVFFQLMNLYINNGGYYDWSTASHKRYIPTEGIKLYDRISPEIIFKMAKTWSYGGKYVFEYDVILNDKDSYLKSFNISIKTPDSDNFVQVNPNNGTFRQYVLPNNLYGGNLDYYAITDVAFTSMKAYNQDSGMFLEETKSANFWYNIGVSDTDFINFDNVDTLKDSMLKIEVTDKKGNVSEVILKISDILDAQN